MGADILEKFNITLKMSKQIFQDEETRISVKGCKTFSIIFSGLYTKVDVARTEENVFSAVNQIFTSAKSKEIVMFV